MLLRKLAVNDCPRMPLKTLGELRASNPISDLGMPLVEIDGESFDRQNTCCHLEGGSYYQIGFCVKYSCHSHVIFMSFMSKNRGLT